MSPRPFVQAAVAAVVLAGCLIAGAVRGDAEPRERAAAPAGTPAATPADQSAPAAPASEEPAIDPDELLATALEPVLDKAGGRLSVALLDLDSAERATYGQEAFDTASIVKVDILAALLLQAQDAGRELSAQESRQAAAMIENSDNEAATALWWAIGGQSGLDAANARLGLGSTTAGPAANWGLTQTTAQDQLTLLEAVFAGESELSGTSQDCLQNLMERIVPGQDWGISAAGSGAALKNGWLPRSSTGLWDINSIGRLSAGGHDYLLAVLSEGNESKAAGIALVEEAAQAAIPAGTGS